MKKFNKIKFDIIVIFMIIILISYIGDLEFMRNFFGDKVCLGNIGTNNPCSENMRNYHNPELHYGFRHMCFIALGFVLGFVSIIKLVADLADNDTN